MKDIYSKPPGLLRGEGDLNDRRTQLPALTGVDLVYFTYPIAAGVVSAAANYASAVREVGRGPRTVVMSMGPAHPDHPSDLGKARWLAEQVLEWAGLDVTILRVSALFHENLLVLHASSMRRESLFRNSFGRGTVAWISGRARTGKRRSHAAGRPGRAAQAHWT